MDCRDGLERTDKWYDTFGQDVGYGQRSYWDFIPIPEAGNDVFVIENNRVDGCEWYLLSAKPCDQGTGVHLAPFDDESGL